MTGKNRLVLMMEGPEQNDHHLELSVFARKISQFLDFLETSAKNNGGDGVAFHVVNLSHSSPAIVECAPTCRGAGAPHPAVVVNSIKNNLALTENETTDSLSHAVLNSLEKLADYSTKKVNRIAIYVNDNDAKEKAYSLDEDFKRKLRDARSGEEKVVSTIDGRLEQINIHNDINTFRIYTSASSVTCKFPKDLLGDVQKALGRFVSVWGECFYRPDATTPHKIIVQEMEILPPTDKLPSLRDLYGIAPNATGDKSPEQFVRQLRDEWG